MAAYVCRISEENLNVIASENPNFDMEEIVDWLNEHGEGYFLRDESSVFDCKYLAEAVFEQMYRFEHKDVDSLFRQVKKI